MKRCAMLAGIAGLRIVLASPAQAISNGPGGRLYMGALTTVNGTNYISLKSYQIGKDWNIVGSLQDHGTIIQRNTGARFIDRMWVCADSDADGDITDDDADYVATLAVAGNTWNGYGYGSDFEIVGKRIFRMPTRYGYKIDYCERTNTAAYSDIRNWVTRALPDLTPSLDGGAAAGMIGGHYACWTMADNATYGTWTNLAIAIDLNDDGDAEDVVNGTNEWRAIFNRASASGTWNDPDRVWPDSEFIEGENSWFLLVNRGGSSLIVIELNANGEFAGTGKPNPDDYIRLIASGAFNGSIEFDSQLKVPPRASLFMMK